MDENVFLVKWYGPFATSEEERLWEKEQSFKCSLYLLHGKLKYAKSREVYYCGESTRNVYKRLCDKGHHIAEIKERLNSIYVGRISNIKHPTRSPIMLVEKTITAYLAEELGEQNLLNATNFYYSSQNVYVINEWWKIDGVSMWARQPINAPSHIVPDVICSHCTENKDIELYGCKKMKRL